MKRTVMINAMLMLMAVSFGQVVLNNNQSFIVPKLLNYQGYLTDDQGNPINNPSLAMTFSIYDASSVGNLKWTENQSVKVEKGIFNVTLGSVTPIPDTVFTGGINRWLELIAGGQTLTPRTRITAMGYAYTATYSDTAQYARNAAADNDWSFRITDGADTTLQTGGQWGLARAGNVLHGNADSTHVNLGVACTTGTSGQDYKYCTVGGGFLNAASGTRATVSGGYYNFASGNRAFVGGGVANTASNSYSAVAGGWYNTASGYGAHAGGGSHNAANGDYSTVSGGQYNTAGDSCDFIGGGYYNHVASKYSTIPGGYADTIFAGADYSHLYGINSNLTQDSTFMVNMPHTWFGDEATGYEFPRQRGSNGQVLGTNGTGQLSWVTDAAGDNDWTFRITDGADTTLQMGGRWGLARAGNVLLGNADSTHVNLGVACTTGTSGQNRKYCTVGGGLRNTASGQNATVGGGLNNTADSSFATVGGGTTNTAIGYTATIGGGILNTASGGYATVGGGYTNMADSSFATIGGGFDNAASGGRATVGGGYSNTASGSHATVGGGYNNDATYSYATVSGGYNNDATYSYATVSGGASNAADTFYATVGGGYYNSASGYSATTGGGYRDTASGNYATVGGGYDNIASGIYAIVGGGQNNTASGIHATVGGGQNNTASGIHATVGGGNADSAKGVYSGVGSGTSNLAGDATSDTSAVVAGGWNNAAVGKYSFVGGGGGNTASGNYATVGGGFNNTASDNHATVGGGFNNTASDNYATVGGGSGNASAGYSSAIPGGINDTITASGDYSMVFGQRVYVNTAYRVVFFDSLNDGRLGINRDDRAGGISYPIHVGTNGFNGGGAHLSASGTWMNASSREYKEAFQSLDGGVVLDRVRAMNISKWRYKNTTEYHIGPVSEDFHSAFGVSEQKYLSGIDVSGVALCAAQELARRLEIQQKEIELLKKRIAELEK